MTDITDEQRADFQSLAAYARSNSDTVVGARIGRMLAMLPPDLTNPQPVLPTERGEYHDEAGNLWWLNSAGWHTQSGHWLDSAARECGPFTRLVPERPQITREQIAALILGYENVDDGINAILAFVNGTDRD